MIDVNENFKNSLTYKDTCPICQNSKDNQSHLLECIKLKEINPNLHVKKNYNDIFSDDCLKIYEVGRILFKALETRKAILK